jgi:hypothetical protein
MPFVYDELRNFQWKTVPKPRRKLCCVTLNAGALKGDVQEQTSIIAIIKLRILVSP